MALVCSGIVKYVIGLIFVTISLYYSIKHLSNKVDLKKFLKK